jgi:hypothetical protein
MRQNACPLTPFAAQRLVSARAVCAPSPRAQGREGQVRGVLLLTLFAAQRLVTAEQLAHPATIIWSSPLLSLLPDPNPDPDPKS